jgi:hypothetical protein
LKPFQRRFFKHGQTQLTYILLCTCHPQTSSFHTISQFIFRQ